MLKKILNLSGIAVAFCLAFSSCTSEKNVFSKRKYLDRERVNHVEVARAEKKNFSKQEKNEMKEISQVKSESQVLNSLEVPVSSGFATSTQPKPEKIERGVVVKEEKVTQRPVESMSENSGINKMAEESSQSQGDVGLVLLVILAIILPPLAVYLVDGIGNSFWISVILTVLFWLPGIIYALYIVLTH